MCEGGEQPYTQLAYTLNMRYPDHPAGLQLNMQYPVTLLAYTLNMRYPDHPAGLHPQYAVP